MLRPLFATIRTIRCSLFAHYSLFAIRRTIRSSLFAIRDYSLFAIRYSCFPDTPRHRARLLKYYPRRPCAPSFVKSRMLRPHISYFFKKYSLFMDVYTRGLLRFLLGFWPLRQNPAGAIMTGFRLRWKHNERGTERISPVLMTSVV